MVNRLFAPYSRLAEPKFDNELVSVSPTRRSCPGLGNQFNRSPMEKTDASFCEGLGQRRKGLCASSLEGSVSIRRAFVDKTKEPGLLAIR